MIPRVRDPYSPKAVHCDTERRLDACLRTVRRYDEGAVRRELEQSVVRIIGNPRIPVGINGDVERLGTREGRRGTRIGELAGADVEYPRVVRITRMIACDGTAAGVGDPDVVLLVRDGTLRRADTALGKAGAGTQHHAVRIEFRHAVRGRNEIGWAGRAEESEIADPDIAVGVQGDPEAGAVEVTLLTSIGSGRDRKSTRLNSSHSQISYAVFCLKKKKKLYSNSIVSTASKTTTTPVCQQSTPSSSVCCTTIWCSVTHVRSESSYARSCTRSRA